MQSFVAGHELTIEIVRDAFDRAGHETKDWSDTGFLVVGEDASNTLVSFHAKQRTLVFMQRWEINAAGRYLEALEFANTANDEYVLGRVAFNPDGWYTIDHALLTHLGLDLRSVLSAFRRFVGVASLMRSELPDDLEPNDESAVDDLQLDAEETDE